MKRFQTFFDHQTRPKNFSGAPGIPKDRVHGSGNGGKTGHRQGMQTSFLFLFLFLSAFGLSASAQSFSETLHMEAEFERPQAPGNKLMVYNIQGDVIVEGYDGDVIEIVVVKQIEARRQGDVERGREELQLVVDESGDRVFVYMDAPFIQVKKVGDSISYNINRGDEDYKFQFDITLRVPERAAVNASTINEGTVRLSNLTSPELLASNINGNVELENVAGTTKANTINGNISATYHQSPKSNSEYKTINGTIEVYYPDNLSADIRFQSLHGDLFTDFENIRRLTPEVETDRSNRRSRTTYRIGRHSPFRIGDGGPEFRFEVLNGNVYVRRMKS